MGVVNVFYKNEMPPVVSRVIVHDGTFYEIKFETHYHDDKLATLNPIPPERIERTEPVPDRPSQLELALMKELSEKPSERAGKVTVQMPVLIRTENPYLSKDVVTICREEIAKYCKENQGAVLRALLECLYVAESYGETLKAQSWRVSDTPAEPPGQNHVTWTFRGETLYKLHAYLAVHKNKVYGVELGPERPKP